MKKAISTISILLVFFLYVNAQTSLAIKATGSVLGYSSGAGIGGGVGFEVNAGKKSTIGVLATLGKVQDIVNLKYSVSPEFRYYTKSAFNGLYFAANGTYDVFKNVNDKDNDFGTYLFGFGGKVGYNALLNEKIILGINLGANAMGPSRSYNSVKSKFTANLEIGYKF
jgi:hypothetical protein